MRQIRKALVITLITHLIGLSVNAEPLKDDAKAKFVASLQNPKAKSYSLMRAGVQAFDAHHALAPSATHLRFILRLRDTTSDSRLEDMTLRIDGHDVAIQALIPSAGALEQNIEENVAYRFADNVLNQEGSDTSWGAHVRSADVPARMRRLGDLRLECRVNVAMGKEHAGFLWNGLINTILVTSDWCSHTKFVPTIKSEQPITSATLVTEERRIPLKIGKDARSYEVPMNDSRLPDSALIEFVFAISK